ncbi:MAG TPA: bacillithiol biosynthesis cysteine-adding enzyme BshC [Puia sp.]|nr:bacillithiol biosynthesis cysteine-adding enzyme BshC [Puia sp.]
MDCTAINLSYQHTEYFSRIIADYLSGDKSLRPFYQHPVTLDGIQAAIHARQQFPTDRNMLVEELKKQYQAVEPRPAVVQNIENLLQNNCFAVTTAHQPAIFTGNLYFIYKILHVIKLAHELGKQLPAYRFVPVFFMGSEDADLEELGTVYLDHEKITWDTNQTGAVGRMKTEGLDKIIDRIEGEYSVQPFGKELSALLKACYLETENIQTATFRLIHSLFSAYGLIVVIPDNARFKKKMLPVFADDLFNHRPSVIAGKTIERLSGEYDIQAKPRDINLFYLKDNIRERIVEQGTRYRVLGNRIEFSKEELEKELNQYPERFSPNVILRGLFQETILPGIAFVGGGGEMAYWLELKDIFENYGVPYPVLVLRNSFLIIEKKWKEKIDRTGFSVQDIFKSEDDLLNEMVRKESGHQLSLDKEIEDANNYYERLKMISHPVDPTLSQYVEALQSKAVKPLIDLEKKLLKAEKRKFEAQRLHIHSIKSALFPLEDLQERIENFLPYYAVWGRKFLDIIYKHSLALEQKFVVLEEL